MSDLILARCDESSEAEEPAESRVGSPARNSLEELLTIDAERIVAIVPVLSVVREAELVSQMVTDRVRLPQRDPKDHVAVEHVDAVYISKLKYLVNREALFVVRVCLLLFAFRFLRCCGKREDETGEDSHQDHDRDRGSPNHRFTTCNE
ncbi:MAG: hypothetical protein ACSLE8_19715 [Rhodococcus sp. (in: high G+C Gram-positive bacteria)]